MKYLLSIRRVAIHNADQLQMKNCSINFKVARLISKLDDFLKFVQSRYIEPR